MTLPPNVEYGQVAPASSWPTHLIVQWQPGPPPRRPVATNLSGPLDGRVVTPGLTENVPVGASGVPAQVHVPADDACAGCAVIAAVEATITAAILVRALIFPASLRGVADRRRLGALPCVHLAS